MAIQRAKHNLVDFEIATNRNYEPNWHHEIIAKELEHIEAFGDRDYKILLVDVPPRHGKLIAHDVPVPTPSGWRRHGELSKGDMVFGRDGAPAKVFWHSEDDIAEYEVSFSDGARIQCHGNHEWIVFDRTRHGWRKYETKEMMEMVIESGPASGRGHRYRLQVDANVSVEYQEENLTLHPYMLGVWLGDGNTTKNCITYATKDVAVMRKLASIGYLASSHNVHSKTGVNTDYIRKLYGELVSEKLKGHKHIPYKYLIASKEQRKELLAGLVDTDGHVDPRGRVRIVTVSLSLAQDIQGLVRSLGMNAYITSQQPSLSSSGIQGKKVVYTVGFNCDIELPTALPRKRTGMSKQQVKRRRAITAINLVKGTAGRCIEVEGGIYLVGETYIPTHNSQQCSIDFPAYFLGRNPEKEIIIASYSADLAQDFGGKTREKVDGDSFKAIFPDVWLKPDEKARGRWRTNEGGGYSSAGVGGPMTGRGAHVLLIDDPTKNREEADSSVYREKNWDWFTSTAFTRLEPGGVAIIIATRWHMADLSGRIMANPDFEGMWKRISFPALALPGDVLRKQGSALWPGRYNENALANIKTIIGPYDWAALYQGSPILNADQEFKPEWRRKTTEEAVSMMSTRRFLTIDTAMSKKAQADYTGFVDNRVNKENFWHLKAWRAKIGPEELVNAIFTLHTSNNYEKIGIEKTTYTQGLKPYLDSEQRKRNTFLPIVELEHSGVNKEVRIRGLIPRYAAGSIFHIDSQCSALEEEQETFPSGIHDDVLDSAAYQLQVADKVHDGGPLSVNIPDYD